MSRTVEIGSRRVGEGAPVFMVAELSANHGGKLDVALKTIEAAARAGADAIKIQTYTPDTLTLKSDAPPFVVETENVWRGRTLHDLYGEAMTPWEWHEQLRDAAHAHGLEFFSTPFDVTAIQFLVELGATAFKIASFELNDIPLIQSAAAHGKPMILSTGMASLADVERAIAACKAMGNEDVIVLRCVSAYPARPASMNLQSFEVLRSMAPIVGLSDHTREHTVAIASVTLGAKLIEKHFVLDRSVGGPDAFFSLEPGEFEALVKAVRDTEAAMGAPRFGPSEEEKASALYRRSLFVASDVAAGELLTCDNVRSVRPAHGLSPRHLPSVLGRRATRSISAATPLSWEMVGERPSSSQVTLRAQGADVADRLSFTAEREGVSVGTATIEVRRPWEAEVAMELDPRAGEDDVAADVLRALEDEARRSGIRRLTAQVGAYERAFRAAGWYGFRRVNGRWHCERVLLTAAD